MAHGLGIEGRIQGRVAAPLRLAPLDQQGLGQRQDEHGAAA
jgi:hypothetical protein